VRGRLGWRATYQLSAYDMHVHDDIITYVTAQNTREATTPAHAAPQALELGARALHAAVTRAAGVVASRVFCAVT